MPIFRLISAAILKCQCNWPVTLAILNCRHIPESQKFNSRIHFSDRRFDINAELQGVINIKRFLSTKSLTTIFNELQKCNYTNQFLDRRIGFYAAFTGMITKIVFLSSQKFKQR